MILKNKKPYSLLFKIITILPIFGFFLLQCYVVDAADLKFSWEPPADTNPDVIGGTVIYWGNESRNYVKRVDLGNVYEATIKELAEDNTYYFAVTCYYIGAPDIESDFSNEVVKTIQTEPAPAADAGTDQTEPAPAAEAGTDQTEPASAADAGTDQTEPAPAAEAGTDQTEPASAADAGTDQAEPAPAADAGTDQTEPAPAADAGTDQVEQEEGIDISGVWGSISTKGRKGILTLFASFNLKNLGTKEVASVKISFYESEDNNFDESDNKLVEHEVSNIKIGSTVDVGLRIENATIGSEYRLIAVIDPEDDLIESNEENNISISSAVLESHQRANSKRRSRQ